MPGKFSKAQPKFARSALKHLIIQMQESHFILSLLSTPDSVLSAGDNFDNVDLLSGELDPFIPQEAILSKYSIMIYTSNNNKKTFYELKDAKFCPSCGEKVIIKKIIYDFHLRHCLAYSSVNLTF